MQYPVIIEQDGNGFIAKFPDIPEALTCGSTYKETLAEAQDALITAFEFYVEDNRPVPAPSAQQKNQDLVEVPPSIWAKVILLNTMIEKDVSQAELAKKSGKTRQEMQRITDIKHATKIDTLNTALKAMGKQFVLEVAPL